MAIILGVINTIRRSGGTRSVNLPVLLAAALMFTAGVLGYSKEGMIAPFAAYLMAAASQRYKVSRIQIVVGVLATNYLIVPRSVAPEVCRNVANTVPSDIPPLLD